MALENGLEHQARPALRRRKDGHYPREFPPVPAVTPLVRTGSPGRHGLWLDQLAEPRPEPDWDQAHDADRKPVFLAARFVKLPSP